MQLTSCWYSTIFHNISFITSFSFCLSSQWLHFFFETSWDIVTNKLNPAYYVHLEKYKIKAAWVKREINKKNLKPQWHLARVKAFAKRSPDSLCLSLVIWICWSCLAICRVALFQPHRAQDTEPFISAVTQKDKVWPTQIFSWNHNNIDVKAGIVQGLILLWGSCHGSSDKRNVQDRTRHLLMNYSTPHCSTV